jgi:ribonuclease HI
VWRIGNGEKVHIWGDRWLPIPSTFCVQSPNNFLDSNAMVSELIDPDSRWWKKNLVEEVFSPDEAIAVQAIPISATNQPDKQVWRGNARGIFSVSSAYYIAKTTELKFQAESSRSVGEGVFWKNLWKMQVPNAWKNFMWRASQNILPTRENLARRKVVRDGSCPICFRECETTYHALWGCSSAMDVWGASAKIFQKSVGDGQDFLQLAEGFFQRCEGRDLELFVATARGIWFRRNLWVFENRFNHPDEVVQNARRAVEEVQNSLEVREKSEHITQEKWQAPPEGWTKLNCDASCDKKNGRIGMGFLLRDKHGKVQAARSMTKKCHVDPTSAEAMAMLQGIIWCAELGIQNVIVEGDAQTIISALREGNQSNASFGHLVDDMRLVLQSMTEWKAAHVRREANGAAHILAKLATRNVIDQIWMYSTPDCICDIVLQEC